MTKTQHKSITILGEPILPGESRTIDMEIAKLHNSAKLKIPIIIKRSKIDGPTILFTAGIHGDEINGIEIVRQLITKKINNPKIGTIICIPIINVFGYINMSRQFPDGRDLNRVFPGRKNGSLASRFAFHILTEILPVVDYAIDFHAGGASRFNAPQIRLAPNSPELKQLADVFNAPFTLFSKNIAGSFRNASQKLNIKMLLFEGGKSLDINTDVADVGTEGVKRVLSFLGMLDTKQAVLNTLPESIYINKSKWIRAQFSGLLHDHNKIGKFVKRGEIMATITDPFGKFEHNVKAPNDGYVINANHAPIVYQGDAVYHISSKISNPIDTQKLEV
jgi:predicted deacylase